MKHVIVSYSTGNVLQIKDWRPFNHMLNCLSTMVLYLTFVHEDVVLYLPFAHEDICKTIHDKAIHIYRK